MKILEVAHLQKEWTFNQQSEQKMAGHSNVNTTSQYIHASLENAKVDHLKTII
jgi:hypothetical protein